MEKQIRDLTYDKTKKEIWGDPTEFDGVKFREFRLKVFEEGKRVGTVKVLHYYKPFNFFYFTDITTEPLLKGLSTDTLAGYGGSMLRNINHFLMTRKGGQIGILQDNIASNHRNEAYPKLHNMYYDHDWTELGNGIHLVYEKGRKLTEEERDELIDLFHVEP